MPGAKILYIGFGELMVSLQPRLCIREGVIFKEITQLSSDVHESLLADGEVFLIGPYTLEPVRQVQRATQQNSLISIILLVFPDQFQKIKQAVQFAYNITKHVTFVSYELGKDITAVVDNAILRSRQRKSFSRIAEKDFYPKPASPHITYKNLTVFLENAPIGAIIFDQHHRIITANTKARDFFYPKLSSVNNTKWSDLFSDGEPPTFGLTPELGTEAVHEVIKVNDQFLEINLSPLNGEGQKAYYLLLLYDITQKINAENKLQSKIDELEFLNQELDQFVNVISHDFKTPLTSIGLLAEMGIKENNPDKQLNFLKQIKSSSNKLRDLLQGLNVLVDATKTKAEKIEPVDFRERLEIVMADYHQLLENGNGNITVDFSLASGMPYFKAHIDSLFSNLITNAIKYRNPEVPLLIEVRSRREKKYTILSVKDNGMGIDLNKNMNKLFQPFKRLTDQGTGSGLGLSIVKRVIEKSQGYLEVFSSPGSGTEFKAYLKSQS